MITAVPVEDKPAWAHVLYEFWESDQLIALVGFTKLDLTLKRAYLFFEPKADLKLKHCREMKRRIAYEFGGLNVEARIYKYNLVAQRFAEFFGIKNTGLMADEETLIFRGEF